MDFLIGGLAGSGATLITNPIDMVKTRLQLQGELRARTEHVARYRGVFHAMVVIARTDGILALQRGVTPAFMFGFFMNSVRLGIYRIAEIEGWTSRSPGVLDLKKAVFWAAISGAFGGLASNPFNVIKIRFHAAEPNASIAVGKQYHYKSLTDALITIYKTEGLRGYYAGINATCCRLSVGSGAQLATFSKAKQTLLNRGIFTNSPFAQAFCASCLSGAAVAVIACPLDVCTVRLYNQGTTGKLLYNGVTDCICKTWRAEGPQGLYKGLGPLYLRMAPHTTLTLVIWDVLHHNWK